VGITKLIPLFTTVLSFVILWGRAERPPEVAQRVDSRYSSKYSMRAAILSASIAFSESRRMKGTTS
jgi:hypothetical protein